MQQEKELERLGKALKAIRIKSGKTQADLGSLINRDFQSISRIENGKVNPSYTLLLEMCEALGVELDQLWEVVKSIK